MRYIDEMKDKHGFRNGGAIPPDAWKARGIYCAVTNSIARHLGSNVRMLPFSHPGGHNGCMVVYTKTTEQLRKDLGENQRKQPGIRRLIALAEKRDYGDKEDTETEPDDAMFEAIGIAEELELHQFIETTVTVDSASLQQTLNETIEKEKG